MAVNVLHQRNPNHCVNGFVLRTTSQASVNAVQCSGWIRPSAKLLVNGTLYSKHFKGIQKYSLKSIEVNRHIANDALTQFLRFLMLRFKRSLKPFQTDFRNVLKLTLKQIRRNFAPSKEKLEINSVVHSLIRGGDAHE